MRKANLTIGLILVMFALKPAFAYGVEPDGWMLADNPGSARILENRHMRAAIEEIFAAFVDRTSMTHHAGQIRDAARAPALHQRHCMETIYSEYQRCPLLLCAGGRVLASWEDALC